MFVDYRLKNYMTNFDDIFRDYFWKYQRRLESSLN